VSNTTVSDAPLYKTVARFNVIYVLESLGLGAPKTGQDLFDSVIYPAKDKLAGIHAEFISVHTKSDLLRRLTLIAHAATRDNIVALGGVVLKYSLGREQQLAQLGRCTRLHCRCDVRIGVQRLSHAAVA
jgi:hypothetical protein